MQEKREIQATNLYLTPEEYQTNEETGETWVTGLVTAKASGLAEKGQRVTVYLDVEGMKQLSGKNESLLLTDLQDLDDPGSKVKAASQEFPGARETSADNPLSEIVCERVGRNDDNTFTCKWVSSLKTGMVSKKTPEGPNPRHGVTFFRREQFKLSDATLAKQDEFNEARKRLENTTDEVEVGEIKETMRELQREVLGTEDNVRFRATVMDDEPIIGLSADPATINVNAEHDDQWTDVARRMSANNQGGRFGGAVIRVRKGDTVVSDLCFEVECRFDRERGRNISGFEAIENMLKYNRKKLQAAHEMGAVIDVLPCENITAGPMFKESYMKKLAEKGMDERLMATFYHPEMAYKSLPPVPENIHGYVGRESAVSVVETRREEPQPFTDDGDLIDGEPPKARNQVMKNVIAGSSDDYVCLMVQKNKNDPEATKMTKAKKLAPEVARKYGLDDEKTPSASASRQSGQTKSASQDSERPSEQKGARNKSAGPGF